MTFSLSAILLGIGLILLAVLILSAVLFTVVILIVHFHGSFFTTYLRTSASIVWPENQDLSFALNKKLAARPATTAIVMPPAAAFSPPVKIPRKPS